MGNMIASPRTGVLLCLGFRLGFYENGLRGAEESLHSFLEPSPCLRAFMVFRCIHVVKGASITSLVPGVGAARSCVNIDWPSGELGLELISNSIMQRSKVISLTLANDAPPV